MVGKINKPSAFQKLIHRIIMWRPVTAFFASRLHWIDNLVLKITNGKFTLSELAGWTILQLTTTGARSNQRRTTPLIGLMDGEKITLIASSFGREHNPGWYYNLKAHPECEVTFKNKVENYIARELEGEEYDHYWQLAVANYAGYDKYKERAAHRHIPVMLLDPKNP